MSQASAFCKCLGLCLPILFAMFSYNEKMFSGYGI